MNRLRTGFKDQSPALYPAFIRWPALNINLERTSKLITASLRLLSLIIIGVLILQVVQLPYPNTQSIPAKGVTLYSAHEAQQAYALFGSKPIELGSIQLRGVVLTGKTADGKDTGFVLLEIDGKATGPVGLGESAGKGMVVQALSAEGATLMYQGQKIDLALSKTPTKKASPTTKSNAPANPNPSLNAPAPAASEAPKPAS